MKVLFVRSVNRGIDTISRNQGDSLQKAGCEVVYFDIVGRRLFGYLTNINRLRKFILKINSDVIHSHYLISEIVAALSFT